MNMKVLITGGQGQLGRALTDLFQEEAKVLAWDLAELDFTDPYATMRMIRTAGPDLIIHGGAYTDVKGCELNPETAYRVNVLGTRNVAAAAQFCDIPLAYISTDFVFDGQKRSPYLEFEPANPLSVYGRSKLAGEDAVRTLVRKHYVIRTAWLYSETGNNFLKTMLRIGAERKQVRIVADQTGTPTYAKDLARAIRVIAAEPFYGVYHASSGGACTWYDFAREIFRQAGEPAEVVPITSAEYGDVVKRPVYSVLENFNLEKTYGYVMRSWEEGLEECLKNISGTG